MLLDVKSEHVIGIEPDRLWKTFAPSKDAADVFNQGLKPVQMDGRRRLDVLNRGHHPNKDVRALFELVRGSSWSDARACPGRSGKGGESNE